MGALEEEKNSRIVVRCEGHAYFYPISDILRLFTGVVPKEGEGTVVCNAGHFFTSENHLLTYSSDGADGSLDLVIVSRVTDEIVETFVREEKAKPAAGEASSESKENNEYVRSLHLSEKRETLSLPLNREVKRQLYKLLTVLFEKNPPWGALTGIRPTQVARELQTEEEMTSIYGVRKDKAHLAFVTRDEEDCVLAATEPSGLHVYVGIPFCPTRCAYCSFVAQEAPRKTKLLPSYVDAVIHEMQEVLPSIPHRIETLYVGGGTPTVLDEELLRKLISGIFENPAMKGLREICVEAGRPDTITEEKLSVLREFGITRICINPQTLCDATLLRVGRRHTADDFLSAFEMARKMGFEVINTDLIAGLPGESAEEFCRSLDKIIALGPENVTVHSLSKKRRADLSREEVLLAEQEDLLRMETMLSYAFSELSRAGYLPYYLYKQKDTIGGHENVGYQKGGTPCIYNVAMMSDRRSVLSFGAGGMSKKVLFEEKEEKNGEHSSELPLLGENVRVERCPCIKDPIQYIEKVEQMAEKKREFFR